MYAEKARRQSLTQRLSNVLVWQCCITGCNTHNTTRLNEMRTRGASLVIARASGMLQPFHSKHALCRAAQKFFFHVVKCSRSAHVVRGTRPPSRPCHRGRAQRWAAAAVPAALAACQRGAWNRSTETLTRPKSTQTGSRFLVGRKVCPRESSRTGSCLQWSASRCCSWQYLL